MRVLAVSDFSLIGRCSLGAYIPIISALGHQVVALPTALLSSQTGGVSDFTNLCLLEECKKITACWKNNKEKFDMLIVGYLPKYEFLEVVNYCMDNLLNKGAKIIVDPVLGDNGELYQGFDHNNINLLRAIINRADIVTPNQTELSLIGRENIKTPTIITTGIIDGDNILTTIENVDRITNFVDVKQNITAHGAGDVFCSILAGMILNNCSLEDSVKSALEFIRICLEDAVTTNSNTTKGLNIEKYLKLIQKI